MIEIPYGQHAWLLLGFIPGIWMFSRWLLGEIPWLDRWILAPVLAVAMFVFSTHAASLCTHSLYSGVTISSLVLGISGYVSAFFKTHLREDENPQKLPTSLWLIWILTTIAVIVPIFRFNFYDEMTVPGHQSTPAQMLNGFYPPVYLAQPSTELRYHYGVDLLFAVAQMFLRIRVDQANDLVTLGLWIMLIPVLWLMGERLVWPGTGTFAAILVPFGMGLTFMGTPTSFPLWHGFAVNGVEMPLPFVANFFQKPWAIGIPVLGMLLMLINRNVGEDRASRRILLAILLSVASLAILEAVAFVVLVVAAGIGLAWELAISRKRGGKIVATGLTIVIGALIGRKLHGFFIPDPRPHAGLMGLGIQWSFSDGGIAHGWRQTLLYNLLFLGLRVPLGLAGLWFARRTTRILAIIMLISAAMLNCFEYIYTNDIIKFAQLVSIALSLGTAGVLARWWNYSWKKTSDATSMRLMRTAIAGLMVVMTALAVGYLGEVWFHPPETLQKTAYYQPYFSLQYPVSDDDAAAISWLRTVVRPPENLYRWPVDIKTADEIADKYCTLGGLPIVWPQFWDKTFGVADATYDARGGMQWTRHELDLNQDAPQVYFVNLVNDLRKQGVAWFVLDVDKEKFILPEMSRRVKIGQARDMKAFGKLKIFYIPLA